MRSFVPRPLLLLVTLLLVAGAIGFIELRLDAARPVSAEADRDPEPTAAEERAGSTTTAAESTAGPTAKAQEEAAKPPRTTKGRAPAGRTENVRPEPGVPDAERIANKEEEHQRAAEIVEPSGFVNADGFSVREATGEEVVLLEFWTYTCFNCQNVQPHMNAWHDAYADEGLRVVGVHTPEFGFERKYANVEAAVREAGIEYPVVLDNAYATWNAYDNRYWPAIYLIDADGFVRHKHFGEGAYEETEKKIRELLVERDRISG